MNERFENGVLLPFNKYDFDIQPINVNQTNKRIYEVIIPSISFNENNLSIVLNLMQ